MTRRSKRLRRKAKARANAQIRAIVEGTPASTLGEGVSVSKPGKIISTSYSQVSYSGPIPPPALLAGYDDIDPGRAAKILQLAEDQSRHRMKLEVKVVDSDISRSWAGLACGMVMGLSLLAGGIVVILNGHDTAGTAIVTSTLAGVVGAFVYGKMSQSAERERKAQLTVKRR